MSDGILVLRHEQRAEIVKALNAIERQIRDVVDESDWQALYVIGTNLSFIRANLIDVPRGSSNEPGCATATALGVGAAHGTCAS